MTDEPGQGLRMRPYLQGTTTDITSGSAATPENPDRTRTRPRPFVLTSGRVRATGPEIGLETQVTAKPGPPPSVAPIATLAPELQAILSLAAEPISVAEISAHVPLHLGVTRILVGDLHSAGYLDVHLADVVNPHDPEIILRVIRGLRALA